MRCLHYKTAFTALRLQKRSGVNTLSIEFCFIAVSIQSALAPTGLEWYGMVWRKHARIATLGLWARCKPALLCCCSRGEGEGARTGHASTYLR